MHPSVLIRSLMIQPQLKAFFLLLLVLLVEAGPPSVTQTYYLLAKAGQKEIESALVLSAVCYLD